MIPVPEKWKRCSSGRPWRNNNVRDLNFFLMQEHIQQVSLSELMTSWSHILPAPSPSMWWDRGVMEGVCLCEWESEHEIGGGGCILFQRWINRRRRGLWHLCFRREIWELSWTPLILSPPGLWCSRAIRPFSNTGVWADIQCQVG